MEGEKNRTVAITATIAKDNAMVRRVWVREVFMG
jgi:hypothetical protein